MIYNYELLSIDEKRAIINAEIRNKEWVIYQLESMIVAENAKEYVDQNSLDGLSSNINDKIAEINALKALLES